MKNRYQTLLTDLAKLKKLFVSPVTMFDEPGKMFTKRYFNTVYVTLPDTGPHRPNSFLCRAGLEPRIPVREAGALTRNAKGCSKPFYITLKKSEKYICNPPGSAPSHRAAVAFGVPC